MVYMYEKTSYITLGQSHCMQKPSKISTEALNKFYSSG